MNKQKIVVCSASDATREIQPLLNDGWIVDKMIAENVSVSVALQTRNQGFDKEIKSICGDIVFILERPVIEGIPQP